MLRPEAIEVVASASSASPSPGRAAVSSRSLIRSQFVRVSFARGRRRMRFQPPDNRSAWTRNFSLPAASAAAGSSVSTGSQVPRSHGITVPAPYRRRRG
jgi:hypothetical protein